MKSKIKRQTQLAALALLTMLSSSLWADVRAYLNQTTVYTGDPVTLTIEAKGNSSGKPDLSVLQQDFQVLGTSTGSSTTIINGNRSSKKSWTVNLIPKQMGKIIIPAISVGNEKTASLELQVTDIPAEVKAQTSEHVYIHARIEKPSALPYVQQQIPYTVKLYFDDSVQSGELLPPQSEEKGAVIIEQLGEDKKYAVTQNGKRFNVLERHYVISPQKSGKLHLQPTLFKGALQPDRQARQDRGLGSLGRLSGNSLLNDFFNDDAFFSGSPFANLASRGKPVTTISEAIDIDVQAIPVTYKGKEWIPAEQLVIKDSWEDAPPEFHVGEPVSRLLTLQAKGLAGSQLPTMNLPESASMRVYPDQDERETRTDGNTVYGVLTQKVNYIPTIEGRLTLPEMTIDWWDVNTKQQRKLTLAARDINVLPGVVGSHRANSVNAKSVINVETNQANQLTHKAEQAVEQSIDNSKTNSDVTGYLGWILTMVILLLAVLVYWFLRRKAQSPSEVSATEPLIPRMIMNNNKQHKKDFLQQLKAACEANQTQQAAKSILQLAKLEWPTDTQLNLGAIARRVENGADEIRQLDQYLYAGKANNHWDGNVLWKTLEQGLTPKQASTPNTQQDIHDLYPQSI